MRKGRGRDRPDKAEKVGRVSLRLVRRDYGPEERDTCPVCRVSPLRRVT